MPWHENITALTFLSINQSRLGGITQQKSCRRDKLGCFVRLLSAEEISQHWIFLYLRCLLSPVNYTTLSPVTGLHTKHINENISGHCSLPPDHWVGLSYIITIQQGKLFLNKRQTWARPVSARDLGLRGSGADLCPTCVLNSKWQWGWWREVEGGGGGSTRWLTRHCCHQDQLESQAGIEQTLRVAEQSQSDRSLSGSLCLLRPCRN